MKHLKHWETVVIRCNDIGARCGDVCDRAEVIRCDDIGARCGDVGAAIERSYRRYRRRVSGNISDCRVGITPQMCNRVTNHGDTSTFSKPACWHDLLFLICLLLYYLFLTSMGRKKINFSIENFKFSIFLLRI